MSKCSNIELPEYIKQEIIASGKYDDPELAIAEAEVAFKNSVRERVIDASSPLYIVQNIATDAGNKTSKVRITGVEYIGPNKYKVIHKTAKGKTGFAIVNRNGLRNELKIWYDKESMDKILSKFLPHNVLFNMDGMSQEDIDKIFLNADISEGTIENIQLEMQKADQEALGGDWDAEHSRELKEVVQHLIGLSRTLADMKIVVTKDMVKGLEEPLGEFDPLNPDAKIRIVKSSLGEEARNKFHMSNEEALVHELTHAAVDWFFNHAPATVSGHLKLQMRELYRYAEEVVTFEDFLPEHEGVYTELEIAKAKERYDYIFGKANDTFNKTTANVKLQEFIAHVMSNKELRQALDKHKPEIKLKEKKPNENILETVSRWFWNAFQKFITKIKRVKGDTLGEEAVKLVYAMTAVQDKYGSKAASRQGMPVNEKIMQKVNETADKLDKVMGTPVNWVIDQITGDEFKGTKIDSKHISDEEWQEVIKSIPLIDSLSKSDNEVHKTLFNSKFIRKWLIQEVKAKRTEKAAKYLEKLNHDIDAYMPKDNDNMFIKLWKAGSLILTFKKMNKVFKNVLDNTALANIQSVLLEKMGIGEGTFVNDIIADFMAGRKTLVDITDMTMQFRSIIDRLRWHNFQGTLTDIVEAFTKININAIENKKYREALNSAGLQPDLQSVYLEYGPDKVKEMLLNDEVINNTINEIKSKLKDVNEYKLEVWYRNIHDAAQYLITGKGIRTNAENIVHMFGMGAYETQDIKYQNEVDMLITLEAMKIAKGRKELAELIDIDKDGVTFFMKYAKGMVKATEEEMRDNGEHHEFVKGQTRDNTDINKDIKYAPMYQKEEMEANGYTFIRMMDTSRSDIDKIDYGVFYNENAGIGKRVDGAVSLQRTSVPGLLLSDKLRLSNPELDDKELFKLFLKARTQAAIEYIEKGYSGMEPVYNDEGYIVDFRYGISIEDKLQYLDMPVNGVERLGRSFGQVGTMKLTNEQNRKLIDIIFDDNKELDTSGDKWKDNSYKYIKLEPKEYELSEEEREILYKNGMKGLKDEGKYGIKTYGEELWSLLPKDAREYIIEKHKQDDLDKGIPEDKIVKRRELYVRKDLIKQLFAYNEPSITDIRIIKRTVPLQVQRRIRQVEDYIKEFVQLLKANVVIKLSSTILGNIYSNAKFLVYAGMSPKKAVDYLWLSRKSLAQWKKDDKERLHYERLMKSATSKKEYNKYNKIKAEIEARMDDNPIKPLVSHGLFQAVVEDIENIEDSNSFSKYFNEKLAKISPEGGLINDVVQTIFLTNKSAAGKFLVAVTQESDFHFRAATYWYGIEQGKSEEEMLRDVTDNFINYSKVINSPFIQWLDRMGPEAFYKYWSNIQRVQVNRLRKNTFRVLMDISAQKLGLSPDAGIFHSNIFSTITRRLSPIDSTLGLLKGGTEIPILHLF